MALTFDWTRMTPSLLDKITDFGLFVRMATQEAIKENVLHASAPPALYIFTAKGVQCHPYSEHAL